MIDDWDVTHTRQDLSPEAWQFIKDKGFFGMIIPKEYGGLQFSALAHSSIVAKLASRSATGTVTVMVPNSLGPAELLLHYGTKAQKDKYLHRLAKGLGLITTGQARCRLVFQVALLGSSAGLYGAALTAS